MSDLEFNIDINIFNTEEKVEDLRCPYCNGKLIKEYDKQRRFKVMACNNFPKCKFSFKIDEL